MCENEERTEGGKRKRDEGPTKGTRVMGIEAGAVHAVWKGWIYTQAWYMNGGSAVAQERGR